MKLFLIALIITASSVWANSCQDYSQIIGPNDELSSLEAVTGTLKHNLSPEFCEAYQSVCGPVLQQMVKTDSRWLTCFHVDRLLTGSKAEIEFRQSGTCGLTDEEIMAIRGYTAGLHTCMNKNIWEKKNDPHQARLIRVLNGALSKLPNYQGLVLRGTTLPPNVKRKHQVGKTVKYDAFTSSSTSMAFIGEDQFIIYSKTGKPVMGLSGATGENEVLFKSGTDFKVLQIIKKSDKTYYVMKEVLPGEDKVTEEALEKKILEQVKNPPRHPELEYDRWHCPLGDGIQPVNVPQVRPPDIMII